MLKPLPPEIPLSKKQTQTKKTLLPKLEHQLQKRVKTEHQMMKTTCLKLVHYVKKAGNYGVKEMGELIHSLHKSALSLEKKRLKLIRTQYRKKKG